MHFTYEPEARVDLQQGDIISRTPEVERLLEEVHPHYFRNSCYRYFIVLTQSCDLVRRDGDPCKARYVSIAAIRPLTLVIEREIAKYQRTEVERRLKLCSREFQPKLIQFVERLLNNNEDEFFYLYREPDIGMDEDHCAFLHLSIAIKAELHYQTLLTARVLQLTYSFQHKLGYLVGSLYSRVGTEDWVPDTCDANEFERRKKEPLDNPALVTWLDKSVHRVVLPKLEQIPDAKLEDLQRLAAEVKVAQESKKRNILGAISAVLADSGLDQQKQTQLVRRLENRPEFQAAFR